MGKYISELEQEESHSSPYCEVCGCCGEFPCCGVGKFLHKHVTNCKYYDIYRKEIMDSIEKVIKAENILCTPGSDKEKLLQLSRVFEVTDE